MIAQGSIGPDSICQEIVQADEISSAPNDTLHIRIPNNNFGRVTDERSIGRGSSRVLNVLVPVPAWNNTTLSPTAPAGPAEQRDRVNIPERGPLDRLDAVSLMRLTALGQTCIPDRYFSRGDADLEPCQKTTRTVLFRYKKG